MKKITFALVGLFLFFSACSSHDDGGGGPSVVSIDGEVKPISQTGLIMNTEYLNNLSVALNKEWRGESTVQTSVTNYLAALAERKSQLLASSQSRQYTNFSFQLCGLSFDKEAPAGATRVVFRFLNFNAAPVGQNADQVKAFLTHLAVRIWGRVPTDLELQALLDSYNAHAATTTADGNLGTAALKTRDTAVYACSAIASSVQALVRGGQTL